MRALVMVFLLSAVCVCANAQAQKASAPTPAYVVTYAQTVVLGASDAAASDEQNQRVFSEPELLPPLSLTPEKPRTYVIPYDQLTYLMGGSQCFKMRSYIVKRQSHDSDVTTPAGYAECTPAARVKMKNAVPQNEQK